MDTTTVPSNTRQTTYLEPFVPSREERAKGTLLWLAARWRDNDPDAVADLIAAFGPTGDSIRDEYVTERAHIIDAARSVVTVTGLYSPALGGFESRWLAFCQAVDQRETLELDRTISAHDRAAQITVTDVLITNLLGVLYWGAPQERTASPVAVTL